MATMIPKPKLVRPVRANVGTTLAYRRRIEALIDDMSASIEYWLQAAYRANPPRLVALAMDASPSEETLFEFRRLNDHWQSKFDDVSHSVAEAYLKNAFRGSDVAMAMALKDAGWTVKFVMTPAMRDAYNASLAENVGLIRSIPAQYLQQVEGIVTRSYTSGRDLGTMVKELKELYPKAKARAAFIARDQSNKANAVATRTRSLELGITEGVWLHSHAGKTPRPTHVAMNGKRYRIADGMWDSAVQKWIQPGEEPNCRCASQIILPHVTA